MGFRTVANKAEASFTEKKSDFIGYIAPAANEEEALAFIDKIRTMHRKATHNCYAYILRNNNISRHSDDGEPSGTAGVPIYEIIRKEGLTDVCIVVTRYFGGIMLGAGGLVRAYSKGAKLAVDAAEIKNMCRADRLLLTMDYTFYGKIGAALAEADCRTESEDFSDKVALTLYVREENTQPLTDKLIDICNGKINVERLQNIEYDFG